MAILGAGLLACDDGGDDDDDDDDEDEDDADRRGGGEPTECVFFGGKGGFTRLLCWVRRGWGDADGAVEDKTQ